MGIYVSRQRSYEDGFLYVELANGGPKKAGKDILTARYGEIGENKNLVDPRDAVAAAERIYKKWELDYVDEKKKLRIVGLDKPMIFEFNKNGLKAAQSWADKIYAGMQKCGHCNKPMGNKTPYQVDDIANTVFCTELCCSLKYKAMFGVEMKSSSSKKKK